MRADAGATLDGGWPADTGSGAPADSGVAADASAADSGIPEAGVVAAGACTPAPTMQGQLGNRVSPISFAGGSLATATVHKIDVDPQEDGCFSELRYEVSRADGCAFSARFATNVDRTAISLSAATLVAHSFCPGWPDADEGVYRYSGDGEASLSVTQRVPDRTAQTSCLTATLRPTGVVTLARTDGAELSLDLADLTFSGSFESAGSTSVRCPCPAGRGGPRCDCVDSRFAGPACDQCADPALVGPNCECRDGVVNSGEGCDDGNAASGDGCNPDCGVEPGWECAQSPSVCSFCGDGVVEGIEACDDGNSTSGDGCESDCRPTAMWACVGSPSECYLCGDGIVQAPEVCDDGNTVGGDGCAATCLGADSVAAYYRVYGPYSATFTPAQGATALSFADIDDGHVEIALPFAFNYFGVPQTTVAVSVNGLLMFSTPGPASDNQSFPDAGGPGGVVAPWWDDLLLDRSIGGAIKTAVLGIAPVRTLVIEWSKLRPANHTSSFHRHFTFQAVLFEQASSIRFRYGDTDWAGGGTGRVSTVSVGLENHDGTVGEALLACTPSCDGRPRPPRADGFPEGQAITMDPVP